MYVMYICYLLFHLYTVPFLYITHKHVFMSLGNEIMAPARFVTDVELTLPMELGS